MKGFSLNRLTPKPIAVVDIQYGNVGIVIALPHDDQPLEIIASGRSDLSFEDRSPEAAVTALSDQINDAVKKALDSYTSSSRHHGSVERVFVVINTPWVRSQTIRTIAKFDTESEVTEHMIADLAKQALDQSTEIDTANLLEASVVRIELNGYVTSSPIGKYAHKISVYALVSGCQPNVRSVVEESIEKLFPSAPIVFRSQLRTILSVTEALPFIDKDYCLVDVARDATIIANIHTGLSMAHKTVNEGMTSIVRRVAGKGMPEETLALLRMLADDSCNSEACAAIMDATTRVEPLLVRTYADAMVELASARYIPPALVLLCEDALAHWLTQLFSRIDFTQFTTTTRPFSVITLNASHLSGFVTKPASLNVEQRVLLAASLVYIEKKHL